MIELYIDNKRVDVAQNTTLPLKWQSNIFGDLSKIVGNKSATITLPLTANNSEIFALAEIPASDGAKARQRLAARCVVDGVPVFNDGYAVLLSVSTGYEIALTWGVITNYNALVADDENLNEVTWLNWGNKGAKPLLVRNPDPTESESNTTWRYLLYYTEASGDRSANVAYFLPSVLVSFLLQQIEQHYHLTIEMPPGRRDYLNGLALLLTGSELNPAQGYIEAVGEVWNGASNWVRMTYSDSNWGVWLLQSGQGAADDYLQMMPPHDGAATLKVRKYYAQPFSLRLQVYTSSHDNVDETFAATYVNPSLGYLLEIEREFEIDWATSIHLTPSSSFGGVIDYTLQTKLDGSPGLWNSQAYGDHYPVDSNLPSITALEFLKDMAARAGVTAVAATDNTLRFISPDQLYTETPQLLPDPISVESIAFSYGDYAQRNILTNVEDDGGSNIGEAAIEVEDTTLETEKELYKSPFGLLYDVQSLHLYEKDGSDYELRDIATRIGAISGGNNVIAATTDWGYITSQYYTAMRQILRKPEVIKCSIHMTLLEVINLDIAKPVYINRLGRRYAVLSIEMRGKDTFNFELLQL